MAKKDKAAAEAAKAKETEDKKAKKGGTATDGSPEEAGKKGKKEKKNKKDKKAKGGKKKGKLKFILILLLILAIGALGAGFYFDQFGIRTTVLDVLAKIGPEGTTYTDVLRQREADVTTREAELADLQEELQRQADKQKAEETRLAKLKDSLDARDSALTEVEIAETPIFRGELTSEKLTELKNLGKIYSNMSAESAAMILPQLYGVADMASIIFYMDKTAAAELLSTLTPELSAQITTEMLRE